MCVCPLPPTPSMMFAVDVVKRAKEEGAAALSARYAPRHPAIVHVPHTPEASIMF